MVDKNEQIVNVWLTEIIKTELEKYSLLMENVYIMPLGVKKVRRLVIFTMNSSYNSYDYLVLKDKQ